MARLAVNGLALENCRHRACAARQRNEGAAAAAACCRLPRDRGRGAGRHGADEWRRVLSVAKLPRSTTPPLVTATGLAGALERPPVFDVPRVNVAHGEAANSSAVTGALVGQTRGTQSRARQARPGRARERAGDGEPAAEIESRDEFEYLLIGIAASARSSSAPRRSYRSSAAQHACEATTGKLTPLFVAERSGAYLAGSDKSRRPAGRRGSPGGEGTGGTRFSPVPWQNG